VSQQMTRDDKGETMETNREAKSDTDEKKENKPRERKQRGMRGCVWPRALLPGVRLIRNWDCCSLNH